jgi:hypothetical protein
LPSSRTAAIIGADFNRFGLLFWDQVYAAHALNRRRRQALEELNEWRNAIARQDFDPARLGGRTALHLGDVQAWRRAVNLRAQDFDEVMRAHLETVVGFHRGENYLPRTWRW